MNAAQKAAVRIMDWLHVAELDLLGVTITTFSGDAGKVTTVRLDDHHGLCFTFGGEKWHPVSTIKYRDEK